MSERMVSLVRQVDKWGGVREGEATDENLGQL
jgi:hypothetical protein